MGVYVNVRTCTNSIESGSSIAYLGGGGELATCARFARFQLSMCTKSLEHVHASSWACAHFSVSICTLTLCTHSSWACACFQLSMCTLPVEHVHMHNPTWACAQIPLASTPPPSPNTQISCWISFPHIHDPQKRGFPPLSPNTPKLYRFPSPQP